jgi:hypothetical protein
MAGDAPVAICGWVAADLETGYAMDRVERHA